MSVVFSHWWIQCANFFTITIFCVSYHESFLFFPDSKMQLKMVIMSGAHLQVSTSRMMGGKRLDMRRLALPLRLEPLLVLWTWQGSVLIDYHTSNVTLQLLMLGMALSSRGWLTHFKKQRVIWTKPQLIMQGDVLWAASRGT